MRFPVGKILGVLVKQISKPIAKVIIAEAKHSPTFKAYICLPPAKLYNWLELKSKMWLLALGKPITIPVLNEEKTIELGATLLGEFIVFAIASGVLLNEVYKSSKKEAKKEANRKAEILQIKHELEELLLQVQEQQVLIRKLVKLRT